MKNTFEMKDTLKDCVTKLSPRVQLKNPVMFIVYLGCIIVTFICVQNFYLKNNNAFEIQVCLWLWFTVLFANFAESLAERKGKAQANSLRKSRQNIKAKVVDENDNTKFHLMESQDLKKGMIILYEVGDIIISDGEIISGIASIDESAITGESAPVIREAGGDRSGVMAGTKVVSDSIKVVVSCEHGESYLDKMVSLIEGAKRRKTPNEVALSILLLFLTVLFIICVISLKFFITYIKNEIFQLTSKEIITYISLLVCLAPTTIGGLLSAIGISGMERLLKKNVLAKSGKAIEMAGDIDVILLDKTGTITYGTRMASEIFPLKDIEITDLAKAALLASIEDKTPEGKSIVHFISQKYNLKSNNLSQQKSMIFIPFTAETRTSGVDILDETGKVISTIRKGATDSIKKIAIAQKMPFPTEAENISRRIAQNGGTPLVVTMNDQVLGVIYLKDTVKSGIRDRFAQLREMGIKTIMITGDNPLTAATIAAEAGVDDFMAQATPTEKLNRILEEQKNGRLVGMIGDGTNDAPALAQADVGIAMNSGTQAAKEAGNMVDLDSDPTKLLSVVEVGKELLMTRGSLTTFSLANDISKYFTILPAIFSNVIIQNNKDILSVLNILHLKSPESAILSTVIFNALVIVALIPVAINGVGKTNSTSQVLLKKNIFIYGLGGIIVPFLMIKLIDIILNILGAV